MAACSSSATTTVTTSSSASSPESPSTSNSCTSDVWKFFTKKKDITKAVCNICNKYYAYCGGTSNLRDHLEKAHALVYQSQRKREGNGTSTAHTQSQLRGFVKTAQRPCSEGRAKEIADKIVAMIVLDMRPIRIVECSGFRSLLNCMEPGYSIPSRKTISSMIHLKHDFGKKKLINLLQQDMTYVALTTDIWTSSSTEAYIALSAHYLTSQFDLINCVLATREFPGSHTGVAISEKICDIVEEFQLTEKVSAVVHDQAANVQLSLRILHTKRGYESIDCNAHKLQLCLKAGLSIGNIARLLRACSKLVGHFRHSALASGQLKRRQQQMNLPEKKLTQSCDTRWNSTFYRVNEMRWPISAVLSDEQVIKRADRGLDLTNVQWLRS